MGSEIEEIKSKLDGGETVQIQGPKYTEGSIQDTSVGRIEIVEMMGRPCHECGGLAPNGRSCQRCDVGPGMLGDRWVQRVRRAEDAHDTDRTDQGDPEPEKEVVVEFDCCDAAVLARPGADIPPAVRRLLSAIAEHSEVKHPELASPPSPWITDETITDEVRDAFITVWSEIAPGRLDEDGSASDKQITHQAARHHISDIKKAAPGTGLEFRKATK